MANWIEEAKLDAGQRLQEAYLAAAAAGELPEGAQLS